MELFKLVVKESNVSGSFKDLNNLEIYAPAKSLLHEIAESFDDKDGNFVEQFQTTAFFPRLWEIFLYVLFNELGINIIKGHNRPDFHLEKKGIVFFVEACTSIQH